MWTQALLVLPMVIFRHLSRTHSMSFGNIRHPTRTQALLTIVIFRHPTRTQTIFPLVIFRHLTRTQAFLPVVIFIHLTRT